MAFVRDDLFDLRDVSVEVHEIHDSNSERESQKDGSSGKQTKSFDKDNEKLVEGLLFQDRYEIKSILGAGSFGGVYKAFDKEDECDVAIKVTRDRKGSRKFARNEVDMLRLLKEHDPNHLQNIVKLKDFFQWNGRSCIVLELLDKSLSCFIKISALKGHLISLPVTRRFGIQLLEALAFLSRPEVNIVHCDIKPDNIVLCSPEASAIKIVDFGGSHRLDDSSVIVIETLNYRSPESLLEITSDGAGDVWAVACVLMEIYTGRILFSGTSVTDQMNKIIEVLGMPPVTLIEQSHRRRLFFQKHAHGNYIPKMPPGKAYSPPGSQTLRDLLLSRGDASDEGRELTSEELAFEDVLSQMLTYNHLIRITAQKALHHNFFVTFNLGRPVRTGNHPSNKIRF